MLLSLQRTTRGLHEPFAQMEAWHVCTFTSQQSKAARAVHSKLTSFALTSLALPFGPASSHAHALTRRSHSQPKPSMMVIPMYILTLLSCPGSPDSAC